MAGRRCELRFVVVNESGHSKDPEEERARRSHVRRSIARSKSDLPLSKRFRFVHHAATSAARDFRGRKVRDDQQALEGQPHGEVLSKQAPTNEVAPSVVDLSMPTFYPNVKSYQELTALKDPSRSLSVKHPLVMSACRHTHVSPVRLDAMFKSGALQTASEPLFDSNHVDATLNVHAVFPGCSDDPLFINALTYAALQIFDNGVVSTDGLRLKGRTIELLNERLRRPKESLTTAVIGAIMILKSIAYKYPDPLAHRAHTIGLNRVINMGRSNDIGLTEQAKRAIFWLDLFAAMLAGSARQLTHLALPPLSCWRREQLPERALPLPIGFLRHRNCLPKGLLDCILDTVELHSVLNLSGVAQLPHHAKYHQLDTMQASIESRLALEADACRQYGIIAEAVQLGVFLVCYCSWMETWNSCLVPCRISEKLVEMIRSSPMFTCDLSPSPWTNRMDVYLWLLFVLSNIAQMDEARTRAPGAQIRCLLNSTKQIQLSQRTVGMSCTSALLQSLSDYIYCPGWLERRHELEDWSDLEICIMALW